MPSILPECFTSNLFVRNDLRAWGRRPWGNPWIVALAAAFLLHFVVALLLSPVEEPPESRHLLYGFATIHVWLQVGVPLLALFVAMPGSNARQRIDDAAPTPIPSHHYFWWIWFRVALIGLAIFLVLYVPLLVRVPWLRAWGQPGDELWEVTTGLGASRNQTYTPSWPSLCCLEALTDLVFIGLLFLPLLRGRILKTVFWGVAILWGLGLLPALLSDMFQLPNSEMGRELSEMALWEEPDHANSASNDTLGYLPSTVRAHPLVTLSYALGALLYGPALGAMIGLFLPWGRLRASLTVVALAAFVDWVLLHAIAWRELEMLYLPWFFLYTWLLFYIAPLGLILVAAKWNALIWIACKTRDRRISSR